jgi:hypothetical protein
VELKFQNVSAVLHGLNLPFVPGYKPRSNSQLLLRKAVQRYLLENAAQVTCPLPPYQRFGRSPG